MHHHTTDVDAYVLKWIAMEKNQFVNKLLRKEKGQSRDKNKKEKRKKHRKLKGSVRCYFVCIRTK